MRKSLLMTTALVALTCGHNAYAENLPTDATNLTSGSYVVERSDTQVSHSGDINLSGTASLDVKTQAIVEEEADEVDISNTLKVSGNVSLADNASLSLINSDATDETEKPFMLVDGKYTQTGGELTLKQENGAGWRSTLNAKDADISSGTIKLDTGEIFIYGNADDGSQFNISGGTFEMNDSNISTYPAMTDKGNAQQGAAMTVSGGMFKMNESSLGRENSGDLDISGGEFMLENGSAIFHDGETGDINISDGTISLKDSSIIRGGDYQSEDGKAASGNINITGGTITADNSEISNDGSGSFNIKDGTVNAVRSELHGKGIEVSGGNITLNGTDFTNDDLAKSFKLTDGTIVMNGNHSVIGTNHGDGNDVTTGKSVVEKLVACLDEEIYKDHKMEIEAKKALDRQIAGFAEKESRLIDLFTGGSITQDLYTKKLTEYRQDKKKLEERLTDYSHLTKQGLITLKYLAGLLLMSDQIWNFLNNDKKQQVLKLLCSEILLDGKNVDISIRKPISALAKIGSCQVWLGWLDYSAPCGLELHGRSSAYADRHTSVWLSLVVEPTSSLVQIRLLNN